MKLVIKYKGDEAASFQPEDTIKDLFNILDVFDKEEIKDVEFIPVFEEEIKESFVEDIPDKEWTIWSSSDFAEADEQIPLVKIKMNDEGELEAIALSDSNFDQESYKIASSSLKYSAGKAIKDRILRVDKSLNHNDPFFSTELQRQNIISTRGMKKEPIEKLLKADPKAISDEPTKRKVALKPNDQGMQMLANQILITNRDDLKAAANLKSASEEKMVELFKDMTGVDYYTEQVVDEDQYNYVLDLLGRSHNKYDESYVSPDENEYVKRLKDLTEDLIEKILLKQDPDFYNR